jgi:hypothetical protein
MVDWPGHADHQRARCNTQTKAKGDKINAMDNEDKVDAASSEGGESKASADQMAVSTLIKGIHF